MVLNEAYNGPIMSYKDQKEWAALNKKLENMEYGILMPGYEVIPPLNRRNYNTTKEDWDKYWRLASPEQFVKQNGGVCWDYVAYKAAWLDNKKIKYNAYYMEFNDGSTHTIITMPVFHNSSKIEYWENSIDYLNGSYYSDTLYEVLELIVNTINKKQKLNLKITSLYEYYPNKEMYGLNSAEYMGYIKKYGRKINLSQLESVMNESVVLDEQRINIIINAIHSEYEKYINDYRAGNQNCLLCTWCLEAQLRGYNILPRPVYSPRDPSLQLRGDSLIKNPVIKFRNKEELRKIITNTGNGSRYYTHVNWENSSSGHEFLLMNVNNVIYVLDGQAGIFADIYTSTGDSYFDINYSESYIIRWDNKNLDINKIKRINDKSNLIIWDDNLDIPYMIKNDMLSQSDIDELRSEGILNENIILNREDIGYNYDKFINGDINYAIIVGFSGSGKSTLGRILSINNVIEHYELDDVITNWNFSDDDFKEYGDLIYSFFKGPGKKYRITYQYLVDNNIDEDHYEIPLLKDFVDYTKKYANSHKAKKFIIEGIWPLLYDHNPEYYKDWCVMIKGTSFAISSYRGSIRDAKNDNNGKFALRPFIKNIKKYIDKPTVSKKMNKNIDEWYKYFNSVITESNDMNAIYKLKIQPVIEWNYIDAPFFTEQEITSILNERYHRDHYNHASDYHRADPSTYRNRIKEIQTLIKNTEDPEEITRLKMELIKLGWNPEIEVSESNISKAKNRVIRLYTEEMNNTCDIIDYSGNYDLYESYALSLGGKDKFFYIVLEDNCAMIYKYNNEIITNSSRVYSVYDEANQLQKQDYNPIVYNTLNSTLFPMGDDYRAMNVAKDLIKENNNNGKFILNKLG